jgi:hypothetical protein
MWAVTTRVRPGSSTGADTDTWFVQLISLVLLSRDLDQVLSADHRERSAIPLFTHSQVLKRGAEKDLQHSQFSLLTFMR